MVNEAFGFSFASLVLVFAQNRYECLREGAFGKHSSQQVGEFEGDEERIGHQACAKRAGDDKVANESEDAGEQCHAADGNEGFEQVHSYGSVVPLEKARHLSPLLQRSNGVA